MNNKKIAVIFGGNSTEYDVSLQSAFAVLENLNTEKYDIIPIGITGRVIGIIILEIIIISRITLGLKGILI